MEKNVMTVKELATYLGIHMDTVYKMAKAKEIPHFRLRSKILFSQDTIDAWIEQQQKQVGGK